MRFRTGQQVNVRLVKDPDWWTRGEIVEPRMGDLYLVRVNGKELTEPGSELAELDLGTLMSSVVDRVAETMGMGRLP
jgi:hypothetical protein